MFFFSPKLTSRKFWVCVFAAITFSVVGVMSPIDIALAIAGFVCSAVVVCVYIISEAAVDRARLVSKTEHIERRYSTDTSYAKGVTVMSEDTMTAAAILCPNEEYDKEYDYES